MIIQVYQLEYVFPQLFVILVVAKVLNLLLVVDDLQSHLVGTLYVQFHQCIAQILVVLQIVLPIAIHLALLPALLVARYKVGYNPDLL